MIKTLRARIRLSASGDGFKPFARSLSRMNESIGFRTHGIASFGCKGTEGLLIGIKDHPRILSETDLEFTISEGITAPSIIHVSSF